MPGVVVSLSKDKVSGWAVHPRLADYRVLVHVIRGTRILASAIANQRPPSTKVRQSQSWFHIGLADFDLPTAELKELVFLIGETDELLRCNNVRAKSRSAETTVEDIIFHNFQRCWVTDETYLDAQAAGVDDADIIELFYRDILDRPADPVGLSNYLFQRRQGIRSLTDIRQTLVESPEYINRIKDTARAPGAIFSRSIVRLVATEVPGGEDVLRANATDVAVEAQAPAAGATAEANWPSYPESHLNGSESDSVEVNMPLDSVLFGSGWHNVEGAGDAAHRWMETSAIIFNPKPELSLFSVSLYLSAVYGSHEPMLECYMDDVPARVSMEQRAPGFVVEIAPASGARRHSKLRIESRVGGCPVQEEKGGDDRILSLDVVRVVYKYLGSHASETADSPLLVSPQHELTRSNRRGVVALLRRMTARVSSLSAARKPSEQ
jgi:hypothetical protein